MLKLLLTAVLLLSMSSTPQAQEASIFLEPDFSNRGKNLSITVASDPPLSGCMLMIYAAGKAKRLNSIERGTLIYQTEEFNESISINASNLRKLRELDGRRFENLYLRSKVSCSGAQYFSATERLKVLRKGSRGPKNISSWIKELKKQIGKVNIELTPAFNSLTFSNPVDMQHPPGKTGKIFIVEQGGKIFSFDQANPDTATLVMDITSRVKFDGEQGLLGLAFHPQYQQNGFFYVNYVNNSGDTVIARFTSADKITADPASELQILTVDQPFSNHNGGQLTFGPDNLLYIALGDGGSGGDPENHAQNKASLLGKILRINVDDAANGNNYSIPSTNPFATVNDGSRQEVYAYGLRNPWRISFDTQTGDLWAGDVGQGAKEEVDIIVSGGNYGWKIKEGTNCFSPSSGCSSAGLIDPVVEYPRSQGQSITGGYVYRGKEIPSLSGFYIYGDFVSGRIWAVKKQGTTVLNSELIDSGFNISSFGQDESGEVYVLDYSSGKILKISS